jgi:hypothetical protein
MVPTMGTWVVSNKHLTVSTVLQNLGKTRALINVYWNLKISCITLPK